ncbi:MAG TPA: TolC family protein [Tepidisphaeraceae bacterium]|jgi:outer membrane protein TolC
MWKAVRRASLLCLVAAVIAAGCHTSGKDPEPFNPRAFTVREREAAPGNQMRPVRPLPTTLESPYIEQPASTQSNKYPPATGPALDASPTIRMSLREIVGRAVANNHQVRVAGFQPAIDETRITEAQARFDPTFFTNFTYSDQVTLSPSQQNVNLQPGQAFGFRTYSADIGIRQDLPTGGRIEAKYTPSRTHESFPSPTFINPNPFWTSNLGLQLTQPLLRDFGWGINQARISIARNNQQISLLDFRNELEKVLRDIEDNYWQLVQAEGEAAVADQLLSETLRTADLLIKRRTQDVTRVEISQTNAAVETRRAVLIRARARVRDFSDTLKGLMGDADLPVAGRTLILPATVPLEEQIRMNLEDQIATAMDNRFEVGQQQLRIDSANTAAKVGKNNLLPQLNAVGSVGIEGLGGTLGDAVEDQFSLDHPSWSLGVQFEFPFGNRGARAIYKRTLLQRQQAIAGYQDAVDKVSVDVKTAWREVQTTWEEIYATRKARFAAADALRAIQQREEGGEALTYTFVDLKLTTQARYAEAQQSEVQAIANYNRALSRLEFAKGTILRYNNVVMEEAPIQRY